MITGAKQWRSGSRRRGSRSHGGEPYGDRCRRRFGGPQVAGVGLDSSGLLQATAGRLRPLRPDVPGDESPPRTAPRPIVLVRSAARTHASRARWRCRRSCRCWTARHRAFASPGGAMRSSHRCSDTRRRHRCGPGSLPTLSLRRPNRGYRTCEVRAHPSDLATARCTRVPEALRSGTAPPRGARRPRSLGMRRRRSDLVRKFRGDRPPLNVLPYTRETTHRQRPAEHAIGMEIQDQPSPLTTFRAGDAELPPLAPVRTRSTTSYRDAPS